MDNLKQKMFEVGAKNLLKTMAEDPKTKSDPCMSLLVDLAQNFKSGSIKMEMTPHGVNVDFQTKDGQLHQVLIT